MKNYTLEDFDHMEDTHVFSKQYEKKKRQALHTGYVRHTPLRLSVMVPIAAVLILAVGGLYAAVSHSDFFRHAFGKTETRQDQPVREESYIMDKGDGNAHEAVHVYPSHEYEEVDEEKAEALIGSNISMQTGSITVKGHTFTLLSAVRDDHFMVLEYTLECPDGENTLVWDEHSADTHGAYFSDPTDFYYQIESAYSKCYVDTARSTDTTLYVTEYYVLSDFETAEVPYPAGESPRITFTYDGGKQEYLDTGAADPLPLTVFTSEEDGYLEISPLGLMVDLSRGLPRPVEDEEDEPVGYDLHDARITITYQDGSEYVVFDNMANIENTSCTVCVESSAYLGFNRLVDVDEIESITVKGVEYRK